MIAMELMGSWETLAQGMTARMEETMQIRISAAFLFSLLIFSLSEAYAE